MDDINMADDSSPSGSLHSQRFNIADMLGESSRSTLESISGALTASAAADAANIGAAQSQSIMFENDETAICHRLQKLYPNLDIKKDSLPRRWNPSNKSPLNISSDLLRVQYKGKGGQSNKDAASVRANIHIPNMSIVYYFEIYIANKGVGGCICVGLSVKGVELNRLPGWDPGSYGYHGDDGNFFASASNGSPYGPKYSTGDTIGCGLNFVTREIFFTKNGKFLGIAAKNVNFGDGLYPVVGMQTASETIDANFGQKPFKFNIEEYMNETQATVVKTIRTIELPPEKAIWMNKTVSAWLEHEGYSRALNALHNATCGAVGGALVADDSAGTPPFLAPVGGGAMTRRSVVKHGQQAASDEEMEARRSAVRLVQAARTADAVKEVERLYPTLLADNKELALLLKIQQYVEAVVEVAKEHSQTMKNDVANNSTTTANSTELWNEFYELPGAPSTSTALAYGTSSTLLKRPVPSYCAENGRNSLKRRSSEEDPESRQSPRRLPHHQQQQHASALNEQGGGVLSAFSPAMANSNNNNRSFSPLYGGGDSAVPARHLAEEPMDVGGSGRGSTIVGGEENSAGGAFSATNGNSTTARASSTNGCAAAAAAAADAGAVGTPPTSTTIIEEFEELNEFSDAWDAGEEKPSSDGDFAAFENGASAENYQHLQKYLPIIEFGHSISQFSQQISSSVTSPSLFKRMNDAFSLIGYTDPTQSNNSYLLEQRQRNIVAKALNRAILDAQGKERSSQIDMYIRKTRFDRHRALPFSTAAFFSDVDRLLFGHPSANSLNNFLPRGLATTTNASHQPTSNRHGGASASEARLTDSGIASTSGGGGGADDDNSNSSGGSSSMGAGGAFEMGGEAKPSTSSS